MSDALSLESLNAWSMDVLQRLTMGSTKVSSLARLTLSARCLGALSTAVR